MKLLITGSNGLLGQKLVDLCLLKQIDFLATSSGAKRYSKCPNSAYATLDITDEQNIIEVLDAYQPTHLIHTAAMTNVDQCELHPEACDLVNRQAVLMLAKYCQQHQSFVPRLRLLRRRNGLRCQSGPCPQKRAWG